MNLAVRTTPPVRVSSRTSTVVRELRTSTVRPALGRFDDVLTRRATSSIDENLYEITFCHEIFMPSSG